MTTTANNNIKGNKGNNVNNVVSKKTLAGIKKQAAAFLGGFRAACLAVLEVANAGDKEAKKLCAYLKINAESVKNKNISETRKFILERLPMYYTVDGSEARYPARLKRVSSDMIEAGVQKGYIAVKDTYLNALIALGSALSKGNEYTQRELKLTESAAAEIAEMNAENTVCIVYDATGAKIGDSAENYIRFRHAKKTAADAAKTIQSTAYLDALK